MPKTTGTSLCIVKHLHGHQVGLFMVGNHHLRHTLAVIDDKRFLTKVDKDDSYLTPIIGVNGTRGIQHGHTTLQCQSAARPHLSLIAHRQGYA